VKSIRVPIFALSTYFAKRKKADEIRRQRLVEQEREAKIEEHKTQEHADRQQIVAATRAALTGSVAVFGWTLPLS
jgi:hypothetical protein